MKEHFLRKTVLFMTLDPWIFLTKMVRLGGPDHGFGENCQER